MNRSQPPDFSLAIGGPVYHAYVWMHLADAQLRFVPRRLFAFILITWVPLCVLSLLDTGTMQRTLSLLTDIEVHVRLLISIPLLIIAEPIVHERLSAVARQFCERGLIAPSDLKRYGAIVASSVKLRDSPILEAAVLLVVVVVGGHWFSQPLLSMKTGAWCVDGTMRLTPAGRWYLLVGVPIFRFLALRWVVRLVVVWYRFLWLVSRIPLRLNALHPDRTGGLGFLNVSPFALVPVLVAEASLASALVAERIRAEGVPLRDFQLDLLALVVGLLVMVLLPQTFFLFQLERAWRAGGAEFGVLSTHYVDNFRRKWLGAHPPNRELLMGSADLQSLADLANAFDVVRDMYLVPITSKTVLRLALVMLIPFTPLLLTIVPFETLMHRVISAFI